MPWKAKNAQRMQLSRQTACLSIFAGFSKTAFAKACKSPDLSQLSALNINNIARETGAARNLLTDADLNDIHFYLRFSIVADRPAISSIYLTRVL